MKEKKEIKELVDVGRRKTAVASVRLRKGTGKVNVNGKDIAEYFPSKFLIKVALSPLEKLDLGSQFDVIVRVKGGGLESQAEATRLGISRTLVLKEESHKETLKDLGYLTRDPRMKERKKYGLAGARKRFQFSKR
ncbi:MAG: 30S ribosomal protein S9 [Simkaniaceae bacterium]